MKKLLTKIFLIALSLFFSNAWSNDKVYFEKPLGRITVGYDINNNETQIKEFRLAAIGPDSIQKAVESYVQTCAQNALNTAVVAAQATPGEATAKLAAAWQTWTVTFQQCMSGDAIAKAAKDSFKIGITEMIKIESGFVFVAKADSDGQRVAAKLWEEAGKQLGGDVGKLFGQYSQLQNKYADAINIDIEIKVPEEISNGAQKIIRSPEEVNRQFAAMAAKLEELNLPEKIPVIVATMENVADGVVKQVDLALKNLEGDVNGVLSKLPKGDPIINLPTSLGNAGKQLNEAGERLLVKTVPDAQKCVGGDHEACCRIGQVNNVCPDDALRCSSGDLGACCRIGRVNSQCPNDTLRCTLGDLSACCRIGQVNNVCPDDTLRCASGDLGACCRLGKINSQCPDDNLRCVLGDRDACCRKLTGSNCPTIPLPKLPPIRL